MNAVGTKIRRIRQMLPDLSPVWQLPEERVQVASSDPWVKRLMFVTLGCFLLAAVLFGVYKMNLGSGVTSVQNVAVGRS